MREGILIPDMQSGRADIRFNSDNCYGGLHCGTTIDIIRSIFSFEDSKMAELLVDAYPEKEISFFSNMLIHLKLQFANDFLQVSLHYKKI